MKTQNYLFLSIFSLVGFMQCVGSSDIIRGKHSRYCLVAYNQDILGRSFIEQNKEEKYIDNDIASIIDAYLPKREIKVLYIPFNYSNEYPNSVALRLNIDMQSVRRDTRVLTHNPIHDIYIFKGATGLLNYRGWVKVAGTFKYFKTEVTKIENVLYVSRSLLDEFHSNPSYDEKKMKKLRLSWRMCDIARLDDGCLNLHDDEILPHKEAYEKVLYPAYNKQVVAPSLVLASKVLLNKLKE